MRPLLLSLAGTAGFLALAAAACSSDYEVDPGFCTRNPAHPECPVGTAGSTGVSGAGGSGGSDTSGAGGGPGGSGGSGGGPMPQGCDPADQPDEAAGLFVDAAAAAGGTGTRAAPFATLAEAVAALSGRPGATIYLRQNAAAYPVNETLVLPSLTGGLVLDGGWGEGWARDCSPDAADKTIVRGATEGASPVLRADGGALTVRRVTVQTVDATVTPAKGQAGTSLVALFVAGPTNLLVEAAALRAGKAGDGGAAAQTTPVAGARACNGLTDCQTGASATTPGLSGATNAAQLTAAAFVPGDGQDGQPGSDGQNGTRTTANDGVENVACFACTGATQPACEMPGNELASDLSSADGRCGCGGKGGAPGLGGKGGGVSAALWVGSAEATVDVVESKLVAGDGGNGSVGGANVEGTKGLSGTPGSPTCRRPQGTASCTWSPDEQACVPFPATLSNNTSIGPAGGNGGNGSPGGLGGPGAGGPSYALVAPTGAGVQVDASSALTVGQGGLGGDGATRAEALPQKTY